MNFWEIFFFKCEKRSPPPPKSIENPATQSGGGVILKNVMCLKLVAFLKLFVRDDSTLKFK